MDTGHLSFYLFTYLYITYSSACQMVDIAVSNTVRVNGWMHTRWRDGSGFLPGGTDTCWVESPPFTACKAALVFSLAAIRQTNERS